MGVLKSCVTLRQIGSSYIPYYARKFGEELSLAIWVYYRAITTVYSATIVYASVKNDWSRTKPQPLENNLVLLSIAMTNFTKNCETLDEKSSQTSEIAVKISEKYFN